MIIQIECFKKHMGRTDTKELKWFKIDCDFVVSQFSFGLSAEAVRLYIHLIGQCVRQNSKEFDLNIEFFANSVKTSTKSVQSALDELSARNYITCTDLYRPVQTCTDLCLEREKERDIYIEKENTNTPPKSGDFVSCVVNAYNNICLDLPRVKLVPDKRKKLILKAKKEIDGLQDLQGWQDLFKTVVNSDFLMGRKTDFKASFDWIIKLDNCTKILEGNYGARIGRKEQAENKLKEYLDSMLKQCEAVNEN